jgi:uncharacterized protein YdhG (YjbR/CyaY superfamily)
MKKPGKSKTPNQQVRAYFAAQTPEARRALTVIRDAIRAVAPDAEEAFAYGIPAFTLDGRPFVYYAAFKGHTSLYPMTAAIRAAHADALRGYKMSTGTIQFPLDRRLPLTLIKRLVKAKAHELRARGTKAS